VVVAFFMGDIYQRAGNTLISRTFAEKVIQTAPHNECIGTLDYHAALLFHLRRPAQYIEVANANNFLENQNHYLIVDREFRLEQIVENLRRIIVSAYPTDTDAQHTFCKADKSMQK
jgi:hypothetical protein